MNRDLETEMLDVLSKCRGIGIPNVELDDMVDLVRAGEYGVALENLSTQLFEYDVLLTPGILGAIKTLVEAMGMHDKYWTQLSSNTA